MLLQSVTPEVAVSTNLARPMIRICGGHERNVLPRHKKDPDRQPELAKMAGMHRMALTEVIGVNQGGLQ
ncbi:MAG: hypothetical protein KDJ88_21925, partial [Bauldia sp.]|nr:hypothetical protein [Bauldia sp.]